MDIERIIKSIPGLDANQRKALRANVEAKVDDPTLGAGAQRILAALEEQQVREREALSAHVASLPRAERVIEAFRRDPMTETECKLVQVLLDNPGQSSAGLSKALGWGGQSWHLHFGTMCQKREARLWPAEPAVVRDANFYCGILADLSDDNRWTIKPDVVEGFAALGLRAHLKGAF